MPAPRYRPLTRFLIPSVLALSWAALLGVFFVAPQHWFVLGIWLLVLGMCMAWGTVRPARELFGPVASRGADPGLVALTFDDGPDPVTTPAIAAHLERAGVRGTFFVVGTRAEAHPEVVRALAAAGHQIALHGHHHQWWRMLREPALIEDLTAADAAVFAILGQHPRWYRPPIGLVAPPLFNVVRRWRLEVAGWSVRPFDGRLVDPAEVERRVRTAVKGGDVILLHDAPPLDGSDRRPPALEALPGILGDLEARGLRAVTMAEMFGRSAAFEGDEVIPQQRSSFTRGPLQLSVWFTGLVLTLSLLWFATAGTAHAAPLPDGLIAAAKELGSHETVQARFEQRKSSVLFVEDMVRTGTLSLRRSDGRLLWSYDDGPAFLLADGRFFPAGKTVEEAGKQGAKGYAMPGGGQLAGVLQAVFTLEPVALATHFDAGETAPGTWELLPKDKAGKAMFSKVTLAVGGEPLAVQKTTMVESTGDVTTLVFSDVVVDGDLPADRFQTPAERSE